MGHSPRRAPGRPRVALVIPCYDEAGRLPVAAFRDGAGRDPSVRFVLVNDGSRDGTLALLRDLERSDPDRFEVIDQQPNQGKGAAVRAGVLHALAQEPEFVGYWDADLATPLDELPRFVATLERRPGLEAVFGARVLLLGRSIRRRAVRHYAGRIFATAASVALGLPVYDTQCGAKLFRVTATTPRLFESPFTGRWTLDVEILARLVRLHRTEGAPDPADLIYELPLRQWHDAPGGKVKPLDLARALIEVARIGRACRRA
jgi:glycosyltransferase involved in cell wall biosynthesis